MLEQETANVHTQELYDWMIIGGGIHGIHLAVRLREKFQDQHISLCIIDPNPELLANWRRQTASTKMKHLRSPSVHHLAEDPFALLKFAGKKRRSRRMNFCYPYDRPKLNFFNRHCESLIAKYDLQKHHVSARAESLVPQDDAMVVTHSSGGQLRAKKVILALGQSDKLKIPDWAEGCSDKIHHIFAPQFHWDAVDDAKRIAIVGGGITAIQVAVFAKSLGKEVHVLCRHPLRVHQFDADPGWLGPKYMSRFSAEEDYSRRRAAIGSARFTGSIPPDLYAKVKRLETDGRLQFHQTEIRSVQEQQSSVQLTCSDQQTVTVDRVILGTGFEKVRPGGKMLDQLIESMDLNLADCGFPIVDKSLAWHSRIHVSGALAELELGPSAKNIAGARAAADRIFGRVVVDYL